MEAMHVGARREARPPGAHHATANGRFMRTNQGPRACLRRAYAFPLVCKHLSKRTTNELFTLVKNKNYEAVHETSVRGLPDGDRGPAASSDFQKNDEVGNMTQFSKRGVWSSENWMGGDE